MSEWTRERVEAHNSKVALGGRRRNLTADSQTVPATTQPLAQLANLSEAIDHAVVEVADTTDQSKLNKSEALFFAELQHRPHLWLGCQNVTLKLGDDCRYTPDFMVVTSEGRIVFYEFKGFWRDDAKVKIKVAARLFRWATFIVVQKVKGGFEETKVNP